MKIACPAQMIRFILLIFLIHSLVDASHAGPTPTPQIIFNRPVGSLVADPVRARVYASVPGENAVIVVDTNSLAVTRSILIGSIPQGLAVSADRSKLWVANSGSTNFAIGVIDLNTLQTLPSLAAPNLPYEVEEGAGHRLYASPSRDLQPNGIMQIDANTGAFQTFGSGPVLIGSDGFLEVSFDRNTLFFGNRNMLPSTLARFNISTVTPAFIQRTTNVGSIGTALRVSHGGQFLVFPNGNGNGPGYSTFEIPTADITMVNGSFAVGPSPGAANFSNDDTLLYHAADTQSEIKIFNTATFFQVGTVPGINRDVNDLTVDRSGRWLFVATADSKEVGELRVFDTGRNDPGPTPLPTSPPIPTPTPTPSPSATPTPSATPQIIFNHLVASLAADPVRSRIYGTVPGDNTVIVVDTASMTVISTIPIGSAPQGLSVSVDGTKLWVANSGSTDSAIGVLDLNTLQVLPSISAPKQPYDIEEGARHRLYLTPNDDSFPNGIMQIDADTGAFQTTFSGGVSINERGYLDVTPDRNTLFFGNSGLGPATLAKFDISIVTPSLVQSTNSVGSDGEGLRVSNDGQFLVFPTRVESTFEIPTANIASVNGTFVGAFPLAVSFSNDDTLLYQAAYNQSVIKIFDTATFLQVGTIPGLPRDVNDLAIDRSGRWLFVATGDFFQEVGEVIVFDTGRADVLPAPSPTPPVPTPTPFNPNNILVSIGSSDAAVNWVREFTVAGSLVRTFLIDYNGVGYPGSENLRDVVVYQPGTIAAYNGTFSPFLTRFSSVSGAVNHTSFAGWSTSNTGHYGRLAAYQDFIFAADQQTSGNGSPNGIVRFDTLNNTITRFITGTDFIDVSMGLDGNLYARTHGFASTVRVYNPLTMALVREIPLPASIIGGSGIWGIAVDQMGRLFVCNGTQSVYRLRPNGALDSSNATGVSGLADINIDETGQIVVASRQNGRIAIGNSAFTSAFSWFDVTTGLPGSNSSLFVSFARPVSAAFPPPTPSPTPAGTLTPTPTPGPTLTPTPTATPTPIPTPSATPVAQALNLSTRMRVQTGDNVGIGGFIISGTVSKNVLVRAIGPSLTQFGVPNALPDPVLELHGPGGFATITNNNWRVNPVQEALIIATGLAPGDNLESAIHANLGPGAYTAVVTGSNNTTGIALIEVYDLSLASPAKLANISTRAFVSTGDDIVIAGFILGNSSGNGRIVLRGIGPSLTQFGVPDALANPTLELRDNNGTLLRGNNDWQDDSAQAAELTAAGLAPSNPLESGIAVTLPPGAYTALLAGFNNGTGNGVVEVYDRGAP